MKLVHQPVALRLVDDKREIQIIGGLRDQINLLVLKQFECRSQFVQDAANILPQQTQGGAGAKDLNAAKLAQGRGQALQCGAIQGVGAGIQGDGDIGFRRGHQIDRQTVLLENLERIGRKPT